MKRTHMSTGIRPKGFYDRKGARTKHWTVCGATVDMTKATTDVAKVTCIPCMKKLAKG